MRLRIPGILVHWLAYGWTSTWRITRLHEERIARAQGLSTSGALAGLFWHQSLLMAAACHHHRHVAALTSRSQDGELVAAHLERIGIRTVRGSSHRGGTAAAKELMRAIDEGWMIASSCDGPSGPAFVVKPGLLEIARRHRVPLLPFSFGALHAWDITSAWDRFRLPWPGTRIAVNYGEAIMYPPEEPDAAELQRRCSEVAERLRELEQEAMEAVGRR